jgi:signal transduction histidine kinase
MEKALQAAIHNPVAAPQGNLRELQLALGLFAAYIACDALTSHFPGRLGITPFNPEAALAIALLMFCGLKYTPLVFIAAAVGEIVLQALARPLFVALLCSAILTAGYVSAAVLLGGRTRALTLLSAPRDVMRLIGVTLLCMLICGMAYVGVLTYFEVGPSGRYFFGTRRFFIGYSVSVLVIAPLVFMAFSAVRRKQIAALMREREAWLQIAAIAACVGWVFQHDQPQHAHNFYLLFLPLTWMATRFGAAGAAVALALLQLGVYLMFFLSGYKPLSVFELQLLMISLALTGLLLGVAIDEQRRLSAEYRESLKLAAAGEMAATIAHEINQPLTALSAYATATRLLAAAPGPDHARLRDTTEKMLVETQRAAAVVKRLRDFFRSGATRLQTVAMGELTANVVGALRARANVAHIALTCEVDGELPRLLADPLQIEVVLRNLIQNALESSAGADEQRRRVDVRVGLNDKREIVVAVQDSGAGIREADMQHLFDAFVTTKAAGMGMGLAISRAIVEAHGGRIWAVPGSAGLLCFALPTAAAAVEK